MEEVLSVFTAGITGVFAGMGLLYISIKLMTVLAKVFENSGDK